MLQAQTLLPCAPLPQYLPCFKGLLVDAAGTLLVPSEPAAEVGGPRAFRICAKSLAPAGVTAAACLAHAQAACVFCRDCCRCTSE